MIAPIPTRLEPHSASEMLLGWNDGSQYVVPYVELRLHCPCAGCVNEHTGQRMIQRSQIQPDIKPTGVQVVGKYAIQITWSDRHDTGMYHFDSLRGLCEKQGRRLS